MRYIALLIFITFTITTTVSFVLYKPPVAYALDPVAWILTGLKWLWDNVAEPAAVSAIRRVILNTIVTDLAEWIQNGETPRFVTNFGGVIEDTTQAAIGDLAQQLPVNLCEPFRLKLQFQIPKPQLPQERVSCTLDKIIGNFEQFRNDFQSGGWIGYQELMKPQNNKFGAEILIASELQEQTAKKVDAVKQEINAGLGFIGQKRCLEWSSLWPEGWIPVPDENIEGRYPTADNKPKIVGMSEQEVQKLIADKKLKCTKDDIITPGQTIANNLSGINNAQIAPLSTAQKLTQIMAEGVGILADAAINRLMREGVTGLQGLFKDDKSPPPGQSNYKPPADVTATVESGQDTLGSYSDSISETIGSDLRGKATTLQTKLVQLASRVSAAQTNNNKKLIEDILNNLLACLQSKSKDQTSARAMKDAAVKRTDELINSEKSVDSLKKRSTDIQKEIADVGTIEGMVFGYDEIESKIADLEKEVSAFELTLKTMEDVIAADSKTANDELKACTSL